MKTLKLVKIGPQTNTITACRAFVTALFSLLLSAGLTVMAETESNGDLPEFHLPSFDVDAIGIDMTYPVPQKMDPPKVHKGLNGTEVTLTFYITKSGKVTMVDDDASRYNNEEFELACLLHRKLRTWRFDPARDKDGNAIAVKVSLPVRVVANGEVSKSQLASLSLKRPVIVAIANK